MQTVTITLNGLQLIILTVLTGVLFVSACYGLPVLLKELKDNAK